MTQSGSQVPHRPAQLLAWDRRNQQKRTAFMRLWLDSHSVPNGIQPKCRMTFCHSVRAGCHVAQIIAEERHMGARAAGFWVLQVSVGGVLLSLAFTGGEVLAAECVQGSSANGGTDNNQLTNTACGQDAGSGTTGLVNTAIGFTSGQNVGGDGNTAIGPSAGSGVTGNNNFAGGQGAGGNATGDRNFAIGRGAGAGVSGEDNYAFGNDAGRDVEGLFNMALGTAAGSADGSGQAVTGSFNFAGGVDAGTGVQGDYNVALGSGAGQSLGAAAEYNTAIGQSAGTSVSGGNNFAAGQSAGDNVQGNANVALGSFAGQNVSESNTVSVGTSSLAQGASSVAVGHNAFAAGQSDTAVGHNASVGADSGSAFGTGATVLAGHTNATAIGANATTTRANQVMLGTSGTTYTMAGIASKASKAAQGTPTHLVTSNASGDLAAHTPSELGLATRSDVAALQSDIDGLGRRDKQLTEGLAAVASLAQPVMLPGQHFAMRAGWGGFDDANALSFTMAGVVAKGLFRPGYGTLVVDGGVGVGTNEGEVAGRAGLSLGW
jgi:trimeric autotransporter adhesin